METVKLYDLPRGTRIQVRFEDDEPIRFRECLFHHVDGMYSFCTVEDCEDDVKPVFHLSASTEMVKDVDIDGPYYHILSQVEPQQKESGEVTQTL